MMKRPDAWPAIQSRHVVIPVVTTALALWWLAQPYAGIRHDAIFYAADALRRLSPASLGHDLFFHRLSQGDFSWFGLVYATLIRWLGVDPAAWLVTLVSRTTWCVAFWLWCRAVVPSYGAAGILLSLVLCLPSTYGALGALSVAEPFATPRPLAEAFVLAALALAWHGRTLFAWMLAGVAFTLHPLMALGGTAVLAWMLPAHRRTAVTVIIMLGLSVLVALGIEPFTRLTQFYDAEWWAIVVQQNPMTVFSRWTAADTGHFLVALLLLIDAARCAPVASAARRMATALAIVAVAAVGAWAWATEFRHVLLIQLQVWRVLWLVQVLAPALWLAAWLRGEITRTNAPAWVLLAVAWCLEVASAPLLAVLALGLMHASHRLPTAIARGFGPLAGLLGLLFVASHVEPLINDKSLAVLELFPEQSVARFLRDPVVALLLLGCMTFSAMRSEMANRLAGRQLFALAVVVVTAALVGWSAWTFRAPADNATPALLRVADRAVRPDSTVWSDAGVRWTWLSLRRAHWVSHEQRAGALFSRDAALTWQAHWAVLQSLGLSGEGGQPSAPQTEVVRVLCTQPGLDVLLLSGAKPGADKVLAAPGTRAQISLFDCQRRRGDI